MWKEIVIFAKPIVKRFIKYLLVKFCHRLIIEIVLDKFSDQEKKDLIKRLNGEVYL